MKERVDAALELVECFLERRALLRVAALHRGGVVDAPVRLARRAGPDRADLAGRVIADRDDQIHLRCIRRSELIPTLGARTRLDALFVQQLQGKRIYFSGGLAARAIGAKTPLAGMIEVSLGEDGARRVAGAEKQH